MRLNSLASTTRCKIQHSIKRMQKENDFFISMMLIKIQIKINNTKAHTACENGVSVLQSNGMIRISLKMQMNMLSWIQCVPFSVYASLDMLDVPIFGTIFSISHCLDQVKSESTGDGKEIEMEILFACMQYNTLCTNVNRKFAFHLKLKSISLCKC